MADFFHHCTLKNTAVLQINPRLHPHMFIKSALILAGYVLCYYMSFFGSQRVLLSLLFAVGMGLFAGEIGVSIQHDGNHGKEYNFFGYSA